MRTEEGREEERREGERMGGEEREGKRRGEERSYGKYNYVGQGYYIPRNVVFYFFVHDLLPLGKTYNSFLPQIVIAWLLYARQWHSNKSKKVPAYILTYIDL